VWPLVRSPCPAVVGATKPKINNAGDGSGRVGVAFGPLSLPCSCGRRLKPLSLHASGRTTGIMIDKGDAVSQAAGHLLLAKAGRGLAEYSRSFHSDSSRSLTLGVWSHYRHHFGWWLWGFASRMPFFDWNVGQGVLCAKFPLLCRLALLKRGMSSKDFATRHLTSIPT
jgi:hypothetical protein